MPSRTRTSLATFDTPDTLLVVSLYPKKGETYSAGTTGVASYTKNLVTNMNRPVIVLADILRKPTKYIEHNTLVNRCFTPNQPVMWRQIFKAIRQFKHPKRVLIQFDFSMYGNMVTSGLVLLLLSILKLYGYRVSVVSHHVVTDAHRLTGQLGLTNSFLDSLKATGYSYFFKLFYVLLGLASHQVIVLEETLKHAITGLVSKQKVVAIPHAIDTNLKVMSKTKARRQLGIPIDQQVVMFFGFANWFKGADLFAEFFQDTHRLLGKETRFIIAGGESATLKKQPYYWQFFEHLLNTVYHSKAVSITGYVPQHQIKAYFAAADLVVFPYRYYMCASGVLSLVFSYTKPFIISKELASMFSSRDLSQAFANNQLNPLDIQFELNKRDALRATKKVLSNGLKKKLQQVGSTMKRERSFAKNATLYEQALFGTSNSQELEVSQLASAYDYQV